jgi:uncharacterized protein YllA (UPF0747 family)
MTLANLTRRNKDYRSKTRRKTKLQQQQQQQMREEKQSIGFERCLQVQKLDAKLFAREREKSGTLLRSAGAVVATNSFQKTYTQVTHWHCVSSAHFTQAA